MDYTKDKGDRVSLTSDDYIRPVCGCDIARGVIKYCPKHKAAPAMYEALKVVVDRIDGFNYPIQFEYPFMRVKEALAKKAEGK